MKTKPECPTYDCCHLCASDIWSLSLRQTYEDGIGGFFLFFLKYLAIVSFKLKEEDENVCKLERQQGPGVKINCNIVEMVNYCYCLVIPLFLLHNTYVIRHTSCHCCCGTCHASRTPASSPQRTANWGGIMLCCCLSETNKSSVMKSLCCGSILPFLCKKGD